MIITRSVYLTCSYNNNNNEQLRNNDSMIIVIIHLYIDFPYYHPAGNHEDERAPGRCLAIAFTVPAACVSVVLAATIIRRLHVQTTNKY